MNTAFALRIAFLVAVPLSAAVALSTVFCVSLSAQDTAAQKAAGGAGEQTASSDRRKDYVSDASFIVGTYAPAKSDRSPKAMADAANALLDTLSAEQKKKVAHPIDSPERAEWTNLPARQNAGGVRMGDLNDKQVQAVCDLIAAMLSDKGYAKMRDIMLADDQLLNGGRARTGFGTENFSVVLFGKPSATTPWAFQLDGHHVGLNVSVSGDSYSMSPSFIGTQPEAFEISGAKFQPLKDESGIAYQLMSSLTIEQKRQAILSPKRGLIQTGPGADFVIPKGEGVTCATLTDEQKEMLLSLISQWLELQPKPFADARMKQVKSEMDEIKFAWNGPAKDRSDVSYTIQSPSLIIEFACQQLGGNPLDHLHTMYRNPKNEYGGQLTK